nr:2OG-Fe(II) oxygenase [Bradyrhizobium sp. 168]
MTAHQDRGFFLVHSDNGSPGTAKRCLSFVYYFRAKKSSFYGGELRIYRSPFERRSTFFGDDYALVYPEDNSIVFFPSSVAHEVLPTYVPSKLFHDSRFTVNGWIQSV